MIVGMFSIYDKVAEEYGPIFNARNNAVAERQFRQVVEDAYSDDDYMLVKVGTFDTETGVTESVITVLNPFELKITEVKEDE